MATTTTNYGLTKPESNEYYNISVHNENMDVIDQQLKSTEDSLGDKLDKTGESKDNTVTFTEASALSNIASGDTHTKLFGKIMKLFSFIGTSALTTVAQTISGAVNELKGNVGNLSGLKTNSKNDLVSAVNENTTQLASIPKFQTAGGTGTAITLIGLDLVDGNSKTFVVSANNSGSATTINGKPLYKPNTTTAPALTAGKAYTIWYSAAGDCFFLKASAEGDAVAANVLAGKTFSNDNDTGISGTMVNNGPAAAETINLTSNNAEYTIPSGYHSGLRKIKAVITGLIGSAIKAGTTVGGTLGTFTSDANAVAGDMLLNKTAYVNGNKVTGSIPTGGNDEYAGWVRGNVGTASISGRAHCYIPTGKYYNGTANNNQQGVFIDDANFIPANIPNGMSMFGLAGSRVSSRVASGTASVHYDKRAAYYSSGWYGGGSGQFSYLSVSGLSFTPRVVVAKSRVVNAGGPYYYNFRTICHPFGPAEWPKVAEVGTLDSGTSAQLVGYMSTVKTNVDGNFYLALGTFVIPVDTYGYTSGVPDFDWIAFE